MQPEITKTLTTGDSPPTRKAADSIREAPSRNGVPLLKIGSATPVTSELVKQLDEELLLGQK